MKNNMKLFVPVVLAILIGSLTFIFAQNGDSHTGKSHSGANTGAPGRGGDFGFGGGIPPQILNRLNLTDAQRTQISTLESDARTASQTYFETIRTADEQLRALTTSGTFDETQARQILATKTQAQIELEIIHLRGEAAIYNLLTAEQRTLLAQLRQQHFDFPRGGRPDATPQN